MSREIDFCFNSTHADIFQFDVTLPHAKGTRHVTVQMKASELERVIDLYKQTQHAGHAVWHLRNPAFPVETCSACIERPITKLQE